MCGTQGGPGKLKLIRLDIIFITSVLVKELKSFYLCKVHLLAYLWYLNNGVVFNLCIKLNCFEELPFT